MSQQSTLIYPEALKSFNSASLSSSYQALGAATSNEARIIKIVNNSTVAVTVSWDGLADHDFVPAGAFVLYDLCTNRSTAVPLLVVQKGTQFYVKGTAGTGLVYLVVLFGNLGTQTIPL